MAGYKLPLGRVPQVNSSGVPYSGALLYVYANGTTTTVSVFTTYDGTGSAANPIVADSEGRFPVRYVDATTRLTLVLKTSGGTTLWSDDNISPEAAASGFLDPTANLDDVASKIASNDNLSTKGSDIASATPDLSAATGPFVDITGTTTITAFGTESAGAKRWVRFTGALTLTHHATSLILPGGANITTAAGDTALLISLGSGNWVCAFYTKASGGAILDSALKPTECWTIAVGDETTAITNGAGKVTFRAPYAFTITAIRGSLTTAQSSGNIFTVDVNESGTTILSTKLTIDNGEKTSTTAATAAVLSDTSIADDAEITIDVDQVGASGDAAGLKVYLIGKRT